MTYGRKGYIDGPRLYPSNADYESWKSTKIQGKFTKNGICPQVSKGQEASSTLSGKRKLGGWGTKIPDYIMEELQGQKELAVTVPGM